MKKTVSLSLVMGIFILIGVYTIYHYMDTSTQNIQALFTLAKEQAQKKDFKRAISIYKKILSLDLKNMDAKIALARALSWNGQYNEATQTIDEVLDKDPNNEEALIVKANIHAWQGNHDESIKHLMALLSKNPKNKVDVLLSISRVYLWKNNKNEAKVYIDQALALEPSNTEAKELLKTFQK